MLSNYSSVADTPEIQRIKTTQQNISDVSSYYFLSAVSGDVVLQEESSFVILWFFKKYFSIKCITSALK